MQLKRVKHVVNILLGIGLMLLMSYQLWGEEKHEWTGIAMTALMSCFHQGTVCAAATGYFAEKDFS